MADITAAMVKDLRERTGAGMMECKRALVEANGDMALAEDVIAKSGHKKAAKSASRTAAEGKITIANDAHGAVMVEINCETDFVGRDENFAHFCKTVAQSALNNNPADVEKLIEMPFEGSVNIEEARKNLISRIGENIQVRRFVQLKATATEKIGAYIHHGRIGVLVLIDGGNDELAKDLAMHIAAMRPEFITTKEVPVAVYEKQKEIFMELAKDSGKPANIVEKMIAGQLQKHFSELCLEGQPFFKDPDQTIAMLLKSKNAQMRQMIRFEVGEGINVTKKSFEEEVAEAAKGTSK